MKKLPIIISRSDIFLNNTNSKLKISRPISIKAFNKAIEKDNKLLIGFQSPQDVIKPTNLQISSFALLVEIYEYNVVDSEKEIIEFSFTPIKKVLIPELIKEDIVEEKQFAKSEIHYIEEEIKVEDIIFVKSQIEKIQEIFQNFLDTPDDGDVILISIKDLILNENLTLSRKVWSIAKILFGQNYEKKYKLWDLKNSDDLLDAFIESIQITPSKEEELKLDDQVNSKLEGFLAKQQKEFYFREKIRTIKELLGDISNKEDDAEALRKKVKANPYPKHIKEKLLSEISKYESSFNSNEAGISKSYIDWLMNIPWWQIKEENIDVENVIKLLDKNHFGMEKVKERIVEYIASYKANPNSKSPIICLVGPPGVGKTTLAKSIAEALDKVFVKISLGGVKDESEIRGHRRTYLGAMPGRIIKGMKKAGVLNPVMLFDEIDKLSSDYKGDPASALLEVLDPEQNKWFSDNYIEEEYDLSKVMFICTANYFDRIPEALYDRLEIIEISSYTLKEKKDIAKKHLIKRNLQEVKLKEKDIKFEDEAIEFIINCYTAEAGVRELDRLIQKIIRKILVSKFKNEETPEVITIDLVKKYLGKIKYDYTKKDKVAIPGVVNGMAYTSAGGDLLPIEATFFPGSGNVVITGNLEKTMTESVNVALGYVKSNIEKFGIVDKDFSKLDFHLHVPAGGIPKDGPSAGVAITTAIISALKNESVDTSISMTGEIMLRGQVGIIGGVKEKVISAHRGGVRKIFMPKDDERFLEDIPKEVLKDVKIILVDKYDEVFNEIFKKN